MRKRIPVLLTVLAVFAVLSLAPAPASAEKAATITQNARDALALLKQNSEAARRLPGDAAGILVFPKILKGGLIIGGQYGEGALFKGEAVRSAEHTSERQSLMRNSYAVF